MREPSTLPPLPRAGLASETGESLWRTFGYFNYYRLAVTSVFLFGAIFFGGFPDSSHDRTLFLRVDLAYWALAAVFVLTNGRRWLSFNRLLTLQVTIDTVALTLLMHAGGGHRSGLAIMLVVVLAGAGLVGQGRLSLLYAAMATLAVLAEQAYRTLTSAGDSADFVAVGILSIGFFATAISARLLAERVIANQDLARQRGVDLDNQLRLNERIIRDMQDGVLVVEPDGRILQCNPQAEALLAIELGKVKTLAQASSGLSEHFVAYLAGAGSPIALLGGEAGGAALRIRFVRPGDQGTVLIYVEDLGRIQSQAQQIKLAALGRLTASIAHEIRNPLAAISHAAELMPDEKRGETLTRLTCIVKDNTRRIERMVREVLELGRRDRAEPQLIALSPFLETFVDEFCHQDRSAREVLRVEGETDATLVFDRTHLNRILWNLLGNCMRHCTRQAGAIRLEMRPQHSANRCELHIIDDGPGIAEEARARIFEPFFTTHSQGTGLGLYIARELCEANRATLYLLANAPGAHFCIAGIAKEL